MIHLILWWIENTFIWWKVASNGRNIGNDKCCEDSFENTFIWYESAKQSKSNARKISQNLRFPHVWSQFFPSICRDIFWLGGYYQNTLVMGVICSFWRMMKLIWWKTIESWYFCLMLRMTRMKLSILDQSRSIDDIIIFDDIIMLTVMRMKENQMDRNVKIMLSIFGTISASGWHYLECLKCWQRVELVKL